MPDHDPADRPDEPPDDIETEGSDATRAAGADETSETATSAGDPLPPLSLKHLGDFELLRELGRGGMGVVYEARQVSLKRRVALKVLPPALGMGSHARQRFEREAQAAAKLHHTNIVPVHAIGEHDGHHFYAMDLIEGQSLDHVLLDLADEGSNPLLDQTLTRAASELTQERPAPTESTHAMSSQGGDVTSSLGDTSAGSRPWFDAVAKLIAEVADGLDYAHGRGVIHRDIKPANLMLSGEGRLCITDFGLARIVQEPRMTVTGSFLGTPAYMSPEQIAAGRMKLDHRTDVYSLGAVLYELLTLHRPFPGDSREEVIGAIMTKDPRAPRKFNRKIPQDLETICLKALEKDPDRRYATAGAFAQDLREYLRHGLIAAKRTGLLRRAGKSIRRRPVAWITVAAVLFVSVAGSFAWRAFSYGRDSDAQRMVAEATHLFSRGDQRGARRKVDAILERNPDEIEAVLLSARIHEKQWHWFEAVADARKVLATDPSDWRAMAVLAAAASKGGVPDVDVDACLEKLANLAPDSAEAYYARGWAESYGGSGKSDKKAVELLSRALELDPGHAGALIARSDAYVGLKDFQAALRDAELLAVAWSDSAVGPSQKAYIYEKLREFDKARVEIEKVFAMDPDRVKTHYRLASIEYAQGNTLAALASIDRAIELDPKVHRSWRRRSTYHRALGEQEAAISDARRAVELHPNTNSYFGLMSSLWNAGYRDEVAPLLNELEREAKSWVHPGSLARLWNIRSWYHKELGEFEQAVSAADCAVELQPARVWPYRRRAEALRLLEGESAIVNDCDRMERLELKGLGEQMARGFAMRDLCRRPERALADFSAAAELAPTWADPLVSRATLYRGEKRYDEALADLDRAIELAPAWVDPYYARARVHAAMERHKEALVDYQRCVELGSNSYSLRRYQARSLARLGRDEDALQAIQEYIDENPANVRGWRQRAILLYNMGRVKEAIATLDHALEIRPGNDNTKMFRVFYGAFDPRSCAAGAEALQEYAKREPENPITWNSVAYVHNAAFHYLCPEQYDPDLALEFAEKATRVDSRNDSYLWSHALVLYRHGRFEEAQEILVRILEIDAPDHSSLFLLSMTHAQLGNRAEARRYYDQAVRRMEEWRDRGPDTTLLRAEAAELLGIQP